MTFSFSDIISINRSCITGTVLSVSLYSYASKYENDPVKSNIIKKIAMIIMLYTIICLVTFNGIALTYKNNNFLNYYAGLTIIMLVIAIVMIYLNF